MPQIPVTSPLGYTGIFLLLSGFFLILAGLHIIKIEKVTVTPGFKTWGFGVFLVFFGIAFLLPDAINSLPQSPTPTPTVSSTTPTLTTSSLSSNDTPTIEIPTYTPSSESSNTSMPTNTPMSLEETGYWIITFGGDKDLDDAKFEAEQIEKQGYIPTIYQSSENNRYVTTVGPFLTHEEAESRLVEVLKIRKDAQIFLFNKWCPKPIEKEGYYKCLKI